MATFARAPRPPLSRFVSVIWAVEDYIAGPHQSERLLPSGDSSLIVHLGDLYPDPILSGPHSRPFELETAAQIDVAGIVFKPGGIFPFVRVHVGDLANSHVPLDALWGPFVGELREQVLAAPTVEGKVDVLEQLLLERLPGARDGRPEIAYAVAEFQRVPSAVAVRDVAARVGLSQRRFLDLFTSEVGLAPKVFCRLRRFRRALGAVSAGREVNWTQVAMNAGYYDQAHFIHDFRAFTGITPTMYERCRLSQNHIVIQD